MTNIDKAADLLYQRSKELLGVDSDVAHRACQEHAQALADAGLLAPELPEPDREGNWGPSWEGVVEAEPGHHAVRFVAGDRQFRQSSQYARQFALALLAAAYHAGEEA